MTAWIWHGLLASFGLTLAGLGLGLLVVAWRRRPIGLHRAFLGVAVAALVLPGLQVAAWSVAPASLWRPAWLERALAPPGSAAVDVAQSSEPAASTPRAQGLSPFHALETAELWSRIDAASEPAASAVSEPTGEQAVGEPIAAGVRLGHGPLLRAQLLAVGARSWPGLLQTVAAVYLAGLTFALVRLARRWRRARCLVERARPTASDPVANQDLAEVWTELCREDPRRGSITLLVSEEIASPACFGWRPGTILVPAAHIPDRDTLRYALLHELCHLERRDPLAMVVQGVFQGLFWFHPVAWWLVRRLENLRELACDATVVARTGHARRYASALLAYAEACVVPRPQTALVPWARSIALLHRRIDMLVDQQTQAPRRPWTRFASLSLAVFFFGTLWSGQVALAAWGPQQKAQEASPFGLLVTHSGQDDPVSTQAAEEEPLALEFLRGEQQRFRLDTPFGLTLSRLSPALAAQLGLDGNTGQLVEHIEPNSLGARIGFQSYDIVTRVNGKAPTDAVWKAATEQYAARGVLRVDLVRRGAPHVLQYGGLNGTGFLDGTTDTKVQALVDRLRSNGYYRSGSYDDARRAFEGALEGQNRSDSETYSKLRSAYDALGRAQSNQSAYTDLMTAYEAAMLRAQDQLGSGSAQDAARTLERAIAILRAQSANESQSDPMGAAARRLLELNAQSDRRDQEALGGLFRTDSPPAKDPLGEVKNAQDRRHALEDRIRRYLQNQDEQNAKFFDEGEARSPKGLSSTIWLEKEIARQRAQLDRQQQELQDLLDRLENLRRADPKNQPVDPRGLREGATEGGVYFSGAR